MHIHRRLASQAIFAHLGSTIYLNSNSSERARLTMTTRQFKRASNDVEYRPFSLNSQFGSSLQVNPRYEI